MRHQVSGYRLGRSSGARLALRRNLIKQFFTHERIHTTKAKASAIRGEAELPYGVDHAIRGMEVIDALFRSEKSACWEPIGRA